MDKINFETLNIEYYENVNLSDYCTWKSGCNVPYIFYPKNINELRTLLNLKCKKYIIGNGSNTLFISLKNTIVISTKKMKSIIFEGEILKVECGASLSLVMSKCLNNGLTGFEFSTGIPGTIGGALITNAGANGGTISDNLISVSILDKNKEVELLKEEIKFEYRKSSITQNQIIIGAKFKLVKGDVLQAKKNINLYLKHRNETQPVKLPSAGSVFRNPLPKFAGEIIEELGLKGLSEGDAQVSELHANYIVNKGKANPNEIFQLIEKVRKKVLQKKGIKLLNEVKIVNEK